MDEDNFNNEQKEQIPDAWDDSSDESEEIVKEKVTKIQPKKVELKKLKQIHYDSPKDWAEYKPIDRKVVPLPPVIQNPALVRKYFEPKQMKNNISKKKKDKAKTNQYRQPVLDSRFDPWQKEMAQKAIEGYHIVLDVVTSCGKTWSVRNIIAEVCLIENFTALFITPNRLIQNEVLEGLLKDNKKNYQKKTQVIAGYQTKKKMSRSETHDLNCQIMCLTADTIVDFMSQKTNQSFLNQLKFVVCDEIHTDSVNAALWRTTLIPQNAQFILSSATIGNTDWLVNELKLFRPGKIHSVRWEIRPVPLQKALFSKDLKLFKDGVRVDVSKKKKSDIIFCANLHDPTDKDISYLEEINGEEPPIFKEKPTREARFYYGQSLVEDLSEEAKETFQNDLDKNIDNSFDLSSMESNLETEGLLAVFQQLHSHQMTPAMYFEKDPARIVMVAKKLLAYIKKLENDDKDVRKQLKNIDKAEKSIKRRRDEEDRRKHINCAEDVDKLQVIDVPQDPAKWRFKVFEQKVPRRTPEWIAELLHYGIGLYTENMHTRLQDVMFKWFANKKLAFLLCDISLSMGINLPARSVILNGNMDLTLYHQMGGRAGRRGMDTEGYVFLLTPPSLTHQLMKGVEEVRHIQPMKSLSMMEILRWNMKYSGFDTPSINHFIKEYANCAKKNNFVQQYMDRYKWIIENTWNRSKYAHLVLFLDDLGSMLLIHLLRTNKLLSKIPSNSRDAETFLLTLMTLLWVPSSEILKGEDKLDFDCLGNLKDEVKELDKIFELNLETYIEKGCSNFIINFFRRGAHDSERREAVGRFQRQYFELMNGLMKMAGEEENWKDKKKDVEDPFLNLMDKIDQTMWSRCQAWSLTV